MRNGLFLTREDIRLPVLRNGVFRNDLDGAGQDSNGRTGRHATKKSEESREMQPERDRRPYVPSVWDRGVLRRMLCNLSTLFHLSELNPLVTDDASVVGE